ncbi:MAG: hypothetical protein GXP15_16465 [Gammaproteobacteria bacterium]|nr:hypothetical protein [Gammaproteobacteria bacterium]
MRKIFRDSAKRFVIRICIALEFAQADNDAINLPAIELTFQQPKSRTRIGGIGPIRVASFTEHCIEITTALRRLACTQMVVYDG